MSGDCFRCGRFGHWASECFAQTTCDGYSLYKSQETTFQSKTTVIGECFRCGRSGHWASDCFAQTTCDGYQLFQGLQGPSKFETGKAKMPGQCFRCGNLGHWAKECSFKTKQEVYNDKQPGNNKRQKMMRRGVYCIQDLAGNIYVGKSEDIDQRIVQHTQEKGPVHELTLLTESLPNDLESWERNETLARMKKHGIQQVRGWMYTSRLLTQETIDSIHKQINEKYDLCRKCGKQGHFANKCTSF